MLKKSFFSLLLRVLTILGKFLLLFLAAKYLSAADFGAYGIITITITLLLYIIGLDFYTYSSREILSTNDKERINTYINSQLCLHIILYVIVLPVCYLFFVFELLSNKFLLFFYLILVGEHLSQEISRLLIAFDRQIESNFIFFLRRGLWAYFLLILFIYDSSYLTLYNILIWWALFSILSVIIGYLYLKIKDKVILNLFNYDVKFIKAGIKSASYFLGSTILFKAIEFMNRHFINVFHGEDLVGAYTFYISVANMLEVVIFTGIVSLIFPKMVAFYQEGKIAEYRSEMKKLSLMIVLTVIVLNIIFIILIDYYLYYVDSSLYDSYKSVFWILLASASVYSISLVPHYGLYVRKMDRPIFFSSLIAFLVVVALDILLISKYDIYGVSIATLAGMLILIIFKSTVLIRNS